MSRKATRIVAALLIAAGLLGGSAVSSVAGTSGTLATGPCCAMK